MATQVHTVSQLWRKQLPHILQIRNSGAQKFFEAFSAPVGQRGAAVKIGSKGSRAITCIDGRCHRGSRQAGGGLFLTDEQFEKLITEKKIQLIVTHAECGAAANAFGNTNVEEQVQTWGQARAKKFGLQHTHHTADEIHTVELGEEKLVCPRGFHPEVVVYFDGTGYFRRTRKLPLGFVIDRAHSPYAHDELKLSMQIAARNGFGPFFDTGTPMHVICIADNNAMLKIMSDETSRIVTHRPFDNPVHFKVDTVLLKISEHAHTTHLATTA